MGRSFEVWTTDDDCDISMFPADSPNKNLLPEEAILKFSFEANTWEEAMQKYHELMGWEKYKPMGTATGCPNDCGSTVYLQGSAECPSCGKIS